MACDGKTYIPDPPRLWSRVENVCFSESDDNIFDEYNNYSMLKKGNVLQHKSNATKLTKKQIYSLIVQKKWTNRNTTWGTQNSRGYTNPNNKMLQRNNSVNIIISLPTPVETDLPIICPSIPNVIIEALPENLSNDSSNDPGPNPELPQIEPPTGGNGTSLPSTPNQDFDDTPTIVPDLGTLSCNIIEIPCTYYTEIKEANDFFHATTDSDVPGNYQLLYWDKTTQTWYPRRRLTMSNSGNKWPYTSGPPVDPTYTAGTSYDI